MITKVRTWIIFEKFGVGEVPLILYDEDVDTTEDEISLCIQEQIYGVKV